MSGSGLSRRRFLALAGGGAVVVGGAAAGLTLTGSPSAVAVGPTDPVVAALERASARSGSGRNVARILTAAPATIDLGGTMVDTWAFDGAVPGGLLRATVGDSLDVTLRNRLPEPTTVHWHGLALRNDMDGVPGITQEPVAPGAEYRYQFQLRHPGTYWFHPHVGTQLDRGLYAPLLIDDPSDPVETDVDAVLMLDDWLDGTGRTPDDELARLRREGMAMGGMGGMTMGGSGMTMDVDPARPLGADTGDVVYPHYLINGRVPADPFVVTAKPGQRVRLRLVNAGGDTAFRVAVGGHRMQVVATDGFPVMPVEVDTVLLGMGERYDVVITAGDGVFPIVSVPEGKDGRAVALLRTTPGAAPAADVAVPGLGGRLLAYRDLVPTTTVALPSVRADRTLAVDLGMAGTYDWTINGRVFAQRTPLPVREGERVRLVFRNGTPMFHPMHLHGHTFALVGAGDRLGARKDTVIVAPGQTVAVELAADNPGQWMMHCHNAYHAEAGMMTVLGYQRDA